MNIVDVKTAAAVYRLIQGLRLNSIDRFNFFHTTLRLQPAEHQTRHINCIGGRRVVHTVAVDVRTVVEHIGNIVRTTLQ